MSSSLSGVGSKTYSSKTTQAQAASAPSLAVQPFTRGQESEVLSFLEASPLHTVFMRGFIRDNGLESPRNRGAFWGCRNRDGQLLGVALIGHATLFEAHNTSAIRAFAAEAQKHANIHMVIGKQEPVEVFWKSYVERGQQPRRMCSELLLEQQGPIPLHKSVGDLRRATIADLAHVMPVQAQMAFAESGVNPMEVDLAGFQQRCARRIELGRVWVCVEKETLTFKADIMSETPEVIYLEGIYVDPSHRGNGYGLGCLAQVSESLLRSARSLCLFVNEQHTEAQEFYSRAGFTQRSRYSTIFLGPRGSRGQLAVRDSGSGHTM
jgi:uncharacterized protein